MIDFTKKYQTRDGRPVTSLNQNPRSDYWVIVGTLDRHRHVWDAKGRWTSGVEHRNDLIEVPQQEKKVMKLEVGKKYKSRGGRIVAIVEKTDNISYPFIGEWRNNQYSYTAEGFYYASQTPNEMDLLEEMVEAAKPTIDFTKPLQTRMGDPVQLITTEGRGQYPIIGYIADSKTPATWTKDGNKLQGVSRTEDLVNVPPAKQVAYINVYAGDQSTGMYRLNDSRAEADERAQPTKGRVACVRIEYTEGQFDA
jgi:hypothetical protein